MTASIRADCPDCGPVETPIAEAQLRVTFEPTDPSAVIEFRCPRCLTTVTTAVGERATRLLMRAEVPVVGSPTSAGHARAAPRERGP